MLSNDFVDRSQGKKLTYFSSFSFTEWLMIRVWKLQASQEIKICLTNIPVLPNTF